MPILGGKIPAVLLLNLAVKAVGRDQVQAASLGVGGQVEEPLLPGQGAAAGQSVFDEVSEEVAEIHLGDREGLGQIELPPEVNPHFPGNLPVIVEQGVESVVFAVHHGAGNVDVFFVGGEIVLNGLQLSLRGKAVQQMEGVLHVMAEPGQLLHIELLLLILGSLHGQQAVFLLQFRVVHQVPAQLINENVEQDVSHQGQPQGRGVFPVDLPHVEIPVGNGNTVDVDPQQQNGKGQKQLPDPVQVDVVNDPGQVFPGRIGEYGPEYQT